MSSDEIPKAGFLPLSLHRQGWLQRATSPTLHRQPSPCQSDAKRKGGCQFSRKHTGPLRPRHGFRVHSLCLIQLPAPATQTVCFTRQVGKRVMVDASASPKRCTFFIREFSKGQGLTHPAASSEKLSQGQLPAAAR